MKKHVAPRMYQIESTNFLSCGDFVLGRSMELL
jgi:hypothetical protein